MKTICFFSGDITRNGGTERVSVMIANQLKREGRYRVIFLSLTEQGGDVFYPLEEGIERFHLGERWLSPGLSYLPLIPKLRRFLRDRQVDVLIDIDVVLDVLSVPAAAFRGTRIISWEHFNCRYEQSYLYRRIIIKLCTSRTAQVVTLTPGDAKAYEKLLGRSDRIRSIYNPVELHGVREGTERKKRIITVGRLVPEKGLDLLVRVAKLVLTSHPDWEWYICGEGPEREMLEALCEQESLTGRLVLTGLVPRVEEYLASSRLFVLTSRTEGLPMCLLEARYHGLPCVSFDIPTGPSELITHGVNGYLIPPFDCEEMAEKIRMLLSQPLLLEEMSLQAGRGLEEFTLPRIMEQWNEVLEKLLC